MWAPAMSLHKKIFKVFEAVIALKIHKLRKLLTDPMGLSFTGGIPDPVLFAMADLKHISEARKSRPEANRKSMPFSPN